FPRLAVPPDREVGGLLRLDLVHRVQDHHALGGLGGKVAEGALATLAAPNGESRSSHFISSTTLFSSSGIGGMASHLNSILPTRPFCTTRLNPPYSARFSGKSSRNWAPRLSWRSSAEVTMAGDTVTRFFKSRA